MAKSYEFEGIETYQDTLTYRQASPQRRRQLNRYKKECGISDEHMLNLLLKEDLECVPQDARDNDNTIAMGMLIVAVLLLWTSLQASMSTGGGANVFLIFLALASFLLVFIVYKTGLLSSYKRAVRQVNKNLKRQPEVPEFTQWDMEHPDKVDRRATNAANAKGRRS